MHEYAVYLLTLPVADIKAIKRAVNILSRAGVEYHLAVETIVDAHRKRREGSFRSRAFVSQAVSR